MFATKSTINICLTLALAGMALFQFCVKPPDYPDEPVIEFKGLSKSTMIQSALGVDSVTITFSYTDGDGDLGFEDNTASLYIQDGRDSFEKPPYRIPFVGTQGAGNGVSGDISIVVPTPCCIFNNVACNTSSFVPQFDTLFYLIKIQDRAGHTSNTIETDMITLRCRN